MLKIAGWIALVCLVTGIVFTATRPSHKQAQVRQRAKDLKQALTPARPVPTEAADLTHKGDCEVALRSVDPDSVLLKNWKQYGPHLTVRVRSGFYHTDFIQKQALDRALRCVASDGREDDQGLKQVTYRDAQSDELVAVWDKPGGFKLAE